jgi:sugar phosphate isomerase/epimerase
MKYSTCIVIYKEPLPQVLDALVAAGFDAVDIPGDKDRFNPKTIKPILDSYSNKLKIGEVTACINPDRDLVNPDAKLRKKAVDYIKYCIQTASDLGVNLTHMCFITNPTNLTGTPREKLESLAKESIKDCAKFAQDHSVTLMMEPLFKQDVTIVNTADQAVNLFASALNMDPKQFLSADTNKQFGLLLDIFHMHHEEKDLVQTISKYSKITYHTHVADHPRGLDFNRSDSKFVSDAIKKLKQLNYSRYVSFETFDDHYQLNTLKTALDMLKKFEK